MHRVLFKSDDGFTTVGAAVALLLVCSLAFAGVRVYRVQSAGADIQYVADAGALAADNAVAEFVTLGQVVDATLLSMSLLGLTAYAAAVVAAFVPGGQGVASKLASAASKVFKARDKAAKSAVKGLNAAQKALPALCALRASACINANSGSTDYFGFAVPLPLKGVDYELPDTSKLDEAAKALEEQNDTVSDAVERAQKIQEELDDSKRSAWLADCGSSGMNMRERAGHLAGLSGLRNPAYASFETWDFSVPLSRARAYYALRYDNEPGAASAGSPELVGESVARKRFYAYACEEVSKNTVGHTASGAEQPRFVHLARNTAQVKATKLYTEAIYPLSSDANGVTLHAYEGCPGYANGAPAGSGSVSMIDQNTAAICPYCAYSPKTLGRVPAASTSIDNGFEYYYRKVADEAERYCALAQQADELRGELEDSKEKAIGAFSKGLKSLKKMRYDPQPPGRYGCICVVLAQRAAGVQLPFVSGDASLGRRVAISGAALAADPASDQGNLISEIGANLLPQQAAGSGLVKGVFGAWGTALQAYGGANDAFADVVNKVIGGIPLVGTELSSWVVSGFQDAVDKAGFKPAKLQTYKPVLINTSHIAARDDGPVSKMLLKAKAGAQAYGDVTAGDLDSLLKTLGVPDKIDNALGEGALTLLSIPLSKVGLGTKDTELSMDVPSGAAVEYAALVSRAKGGG